MTPPKGDQTEQVDRLKSESHLAIDTAPANPSALGVTVSIEKSQTLLPDSWSTLTSDSSPLGSTLSTQDSSNDSKAFYRLQVTTP